MNRTFTNSVLFQEGCANTTGARWTWTVRTTSSI